MHKKSKKKQSLYNRNSGAQIREEYYYQKSDDSAVSLRVTGASSDTKKNNLFFNLFLNFLMLVFFDCGIFAALRIIKNFSDISFNESFVYIGALIFSVALWVISQFKKVKNTHLFLVGIGLCLLLFIVFYHKIITQINIIIGLIIWSPAFIDLVDISHAVLFCCALSILIFYSLTFCAGKGWILVLVCTPFIIMSAVFDIDIELLDLFFLGLYFVGSYTIGNVHNPSKRKKRKVHRLSPSERMGAGASGAAMLMAMFLLFSIFSYLFATPRMEELYEVPMNVESMVQQTISKVLEIHPDNGNVNKGNNYSFGQKHLEVTSSKVPESSLYLKNYTGGYYDNGRWNTVNENSFFTGDSEETEYLREFFNNPYYALSTDESLEAMTVSVHSLKSMITGECVPALSKEISSDNGWKTYSTYDLSTLLSSNIDIAADDYDDYVSTAYMYVPEEKLPRLLELCENSGVRKGDYEAVTNFILQTFEEMTTYTTTPGNAPYNVDIAEYFLFDSGKGFCQQYATTAALMYRILGLPSRYVTGYIVSPSLFVKGADGVYTASVTDKKAHAWVEVYVSGTGWVPTEVTFSNEEIIQGGTNDETENNTEEQTETPTEATTETEEPTEATTEPISSSEDTSTDPEGNSETDNENQQDNDAGWGILFQALKIFLCLIAAAAVLLAVIFFFKGRRKRKLLGQMRKKTNILFIRMMEAIHLAGYLNDYNGTEEDFPNKLSELIKTVSEEDIALFVNLANKAAFGNTPVDKENKLVVYEYYCKVVDFAFEKLGFFKKLYFKYIRVYH